MNYATHTLLFDIFLLAYFEKRFNWPRLDPASKRFLLEYMRHIKCEQQRHEDAALALFKLNSEDATGS